VTVSSLLCEFNWYVINSVFEKTCEATQKKRKKSCFLDFEKKRTKNVKKRTGSHSAGAALDPKYNCEAYSQSTNEEVMSGFCNVLEKFYSDDVEKQSLALQQLSQFRQANGIFSSKSFD